MKTRNLIFVMLLAGGAAAGQSHAAAQLSSLQNPTLQTLIDLGATGVDVGGDAFNNFTFTVGTASGPATASQIKVQPTNGNGEGLQFEATWFAADGSQVADIISYDVTASTPAQNTASINLFANGTAPAPVTGTFTTATLTAQTTGGVPAAPVLSTYNDGVTAPVDTTKPDVNYASASFIPQNALQITDSIFVISTAPSAGTGGGLATISVVQNTFGSVPEPSMMGWIIPATAVVLTGLSQRRRRISPRILGA